MQNTAEDTILALMYNDDGAWPTQPDELGYSLVPTVYNPTNNQNDPIDWRASYNVGGSPGVDDVDISSIPEPVLEQKMLLARIILILSQSSLISTIKFLRMHLYK